MSKNSIAILASMACLVASLASAQSTSSFPEMPASSKTLRIQNQAEEVYERTDYKRAYGIYFNDLAPIGDKYAQYMVGFMHLTGKGVEEDRITASAWYRLAAERDTKEFVRARDQIMASLDAAQVAESDRRFIELRQEIGDLVLVARLVRKDYDELQNRTGTRLASGSSPMSVVEVSSSGAVRSGSEYYGRIERRMKARLEYIAEHTEIGIHDLSPNSMDVETIEQQVTAHLSTLD